MAEIDESKVETQEKPPVVEPAKADNKAENEEITRLKAALSRANSEAADWKRQLRERQTEQERKDAEAAEQRRAELAELESLRNDKRINTYKAKLMEAGIDGATADLMAKALPDGVNEEYFNATKTFLSNQRQAIEADSLKKQPPLSVGTPPSGASVKTEEDAKYDRWFGLA